jgi:hypothetical protein
MDDFIRRGGPAPPKEGGVCDAVYDGGYPNTENVMFPDSIYDYDTLCKEFTNGKRAPSGTYVVAPPRTIDEFMKFMWGLQFYDEKAIKEYSPPGIYTWMIYSTPERKDAFIAAQVKDIFEIGVKHKVLAGVYGATHVHGAGELLKKRDGTVFFNLMSGTYTRSWLLKRDEFRKGKCDADELAEKIEESFKTKLPDSTYLERVFKAAPPGDADRKPYEDAGFRLIDISGLEISECRAKIRDILSVKGGTRRRRRRRYTRRR